MSPSAKHKYELLLPGHPQLSASLCAGQSPGSGLRGPPAQDTFSLLLTFLQRSFNMRTLNKSKIPTSTGTQAFLRVTPTSRGSPRHRGPINEAFLIYLIWFQGLRVPGPILQMGKTEAWGSNHPRAHSQQVAELPPYPGLSGPQSHCSPGSSTFSD